MSVTTASVTIRRAQCYGSPNYYLGIRIAATGDGTAGVINYQMTNLGDYIPQKAEVWVVDAVTSNNDDSTRLCSIELTYSDWEVCTTPKLVATNAAAVLTDGQATPSFITPVTSRAQLFPMFLGQKTVVNPSIFAQCATNTNAKIYGFFVTFLVKPLP